MTTSLTSRLVDVLTEILDLEEREIVRGDIEESGATGNQAAREVFGLLVRRQLDQWTHWQPWITFSALILPLAFVLSIVSERTARGSSVYLWMYANNWHWSDVQNAGFWRVLGESTLLVLTGQLALVCGAWSGGFLIGAISRKMVFTNSLLLALMLLLGAAVGAPLYEEFYSQYLHRSFGMPFFPDPNAPVFDVAFYRQAFPLIVQGAFVVIPALWGIPRGAGLADFSRPIRILLWTAAMVSLTVMLAQDQDLWIFLRVPMRPVFTQRWMQLLQITVYWPTLYLGALAIGRFRKTTAVEGEYIR